VRFLTLRDVDVSSRRVLVREDLNVPLKDGKVADETRIDASLETLRHLRRNDARIVIMSHLGRPDGKRDPKLSLKPVAERLSAKLGVAVKFADDCIGRPIEAQTQALKDGEVMLLENLRFHPEEEANDPMFARALAKNGEIYVNDAFGTAHRAHASTEAIAHLLPAVAGLLMQAELDALGRLVDDPAQPFVCAIGGAKVQDKVGVFDFLIDRVAGFVIGGGMANTFLAAKGINVGTSLRDPDLSHAENILKVASSRGVPLHLPTDVVVADSFDADDTATAASLREIGERMILDIGPESAQVYAAVLRDAKTIVFNGPMGVYEKPAYQAGTKAILQAIAEATKGGATSVVGGGDAAAAAHMLGFDHAVTHVSTGGGATLEFLEGKTLPGVAALEQAAQAKR
jgi:phosphoglycerate kinase